jgi:hypothetical protein
VGMPTADLDELTKRARGVRAQAAAAVEVTLGRIADRLDKQTADRDLMRLIVPVLITAPQVPLAAGAGTLNQPDLLGPHEGFAWDVRRLTAASFTAGTVTAYLNYQADENIVVQWTQAGSFFFSGNVILGDSDALIFVATGITGQVTISGQAVNVPTPLLPEYLL